MNTLKSVLIFLAGATIGVLGAVFAYKVYPTINIETNSGIEIEESLPTSWSETDFDSIIDSANNSSIVPSVMLVSAFNNFLLVPNRFYLQTVNNEGSRFNSAGIIDPSTGMTDFQSGSIAIFDLSSSNANTAQYRTTRDARSEELVNCYGIDIALDRVISNSSNVTVVSATLFKDDLMVIISDGQDYNLWKKVLSRFVADSGDNGQCLDSIEYIDLQLP